MKNKPIFNSFIAKQLLNKGHNIVDLQPNKTIKNAIVFYFEETNQLIKDLQECK